VIRHVPAAMLLTAGCEKSFVALLHNRQWHLALLFAHLAVMFEFGGNHVPVLDTQSSTRKYFPSRRTKITLGFSFYDGAA
jgi:hypothetical protein